VYPASDAIRIRPVFPVLRQLVPISGSPLDREALLTSLLEINELLLYSSLHLFEEIGHPLEDDDNLELSLVVAGNIVILAGVDRNGLAAHESDVVSLQDGLHGGYDEVVGGVIEPGKVLLSSRERCI